MNLGTEFRGLNIILTKVRGAYHHEVVVRRRLVLIPPEGEHKYLQGGLSFQHNFSEDG